MIDMYVYETMTEAMTDLRKRGFSVDFNLEENCLVCNEEKFHPEDFEITEVYRFEGDSDPADQAVVYAIESKTGLKGILVNAYGLYADAMSNEIIQKLSFHKN
jgi:hypothetical protein